MAFLDSVVSVWRSKKTHRDSQRRHNRRQLFLERLEDRSLLSTFSVLNLDDSGAGSLRQAIEDANAAPGADFIEFDVAGTIELTSGAVPAITGPVHIDGTTAPGFASSLSKTPVVEVDANGFIGLQFNSGSHGSTLQSLGIVDAGSAGVTLNSSGITLIGNFIGVELDGTTAAGNNGDGVVINSSRNTLGGTPGLGGEEGEFRNIISANSGNGIAIYGSSFNRIVANFIGADVTGASDLGNAGNGILLTGKGAKFNEIGGETPLDESPRDTYQGKPVDGNVISGNDQNGVLLTNRAQSNLLAGNFIGTDITGNNDLGNALDGVAIVRSHNNALRGTHFFQAPFVFYNVVSGNDGHGLRIHNSNNTVIHANFFGMPADNGLDPLNPNPIGNNLDGVLIEGRSANTQFGGPIPLGNVVAANGKHGIEVRDRARGFVSDNTFSGMGAFNNSTNFGNGLDGLHITSTGGNNLAQTSLFGANGDDGVEISGRAHGVTIQQSIIGLNVTAPPGITPLSNGDNGVEIGGHAHHNFIGLTNPQFSVAPQNTIGANGNNGVAIIGNANHNQVFGSFIGANVFGENPPLLPPVGNTNAGVFLGGNSHHNIIGGRDDGDANLITGNFGQGVELSGATHHNQVIANLIGSDRDGDEGVGNQSAGVFLDNGTHRNTIKGNLARNNSDSGYRVEGSNFNRFIKNEAEENDGDGFHVENSNFNRFIKNEAEENDGDGFRVENSNFNRFIKNEAEENIGFGFFVDEILDNIFEGNECESNLLGDSNLPDIC